MGIFGEILCIVLGFVVYYAQFGEGAKETWEDSKYEYSWGPDWGLLLAMYLLWNYWKQWRLYAALKNDKLEG